MDRRRFMQAGAGTAAFLAARERALGQAVQIPLPGSAIPKFLDPLPVLDVSSVVPATSRTMKTVVLPGASQVAVHMREFLAKMLPAGFVPPGLPVGQPYNGAYVWGYIVGAAAPTVPLDTYIGPVFVVARGAPTEVRFVNNLGIASTSQVLAWKNSTDQTMHWADPLNGEANACNMNIQPGMPPVGNCGLHYNGPIPAVPHLHGGEVPPVLDGGPDAWYTSDGLYKGHAYYTKAGALGNEAIYRYPNTQEAAPIWFHDHVLGITRLNVYAGLAGAYLVVDPKPGNFNFPGPANLPLPQEIIPMVIQDRMFDINGQLFFPAVGINPEHPFWLPEFEGDVIVVNGKAWPYLNVAPKRYRFWFINGSNARTYDMFLINQVTGADGPAMWVIGTDGGYLDAPVPVQKLLMMPGERYEVIIDFAGLANQTLLVRNTGRTPFPKGAPPHGSTLGQVMQIRVGAGPVVDTSYNPALGTPLRTAPHTIVRLPGAPGGPAIVTAPGPTQNVHKVRQLTLNEIMGPGGPLEVVLNNTKWGGRSTGFPPGGVRPDFTPVTVGSVTSWYSELPNEGETELWDIVNITADAHPIHLHLVQFQLVNRQNFNVNRYNGAYAAAFPGGLFVPLYGPPLHYATGNPRALGGNPDITPYLQGPMRPPDPNEAGWKDTVIMYPGQVTRIVVRWAPTDKLLNDPNLYYPFDPNAGGHGYVWHCHIIDHEDNEMMRPDLVTPNPGATRTFIQGPDY